MTATPQTPDHLCAGDKQNADGDSAKHKPGGDKAPSRAKRIGFAIFVIVAVASVAVPTVWAVCLSVKLLSLPVSVPRPHDYEAALENLLELQELAISEAEAGHAAFFVAHTGCATPDVWQDKHVLKNFERMRELGVELKLLVGRTNNKGQTLPDPKWPDQFLAKLDDSGVADTLEVLPRELYCHSIVAGSERKARAYITSHEEMNIYPTTYYTVGDNDACQQWKAYLTDKWEKNRSGKNPSRKE